jgi:hypothetical protein
MLIFSTKKIILTQPHETLNIEIENKNNGCDAELRQVE